MNIILVGTGSMLGGISRYLFSGMIKHVIPVTFPLGTFLVNIIGCFAIGIVSGLLTSSTNLTTGHRLFLAVGFCGSFTTFSTFSLDNLHLLTSKAYFLLTLNISLSLLIGLIATGIGYSICQK